MEPNMASQVLNGASNPSYTNTTGQNVRVIFNFLRNPTSITWAGVSASSSLGTLPEEVMLAPNQSFSAVCGAFNIVIIKEDGT